MKKIFSRVLIYCCTIVLCYTLTILFIARSLNRDDIYTLPTGKSILIIGASQTTYGVNDSLIADAYNISKPGDAYLYTFAKLRKLIPLNPGIKTVVVSISEQSITQRMINLWMHNNGFMDEKIHSYLHLINLPELAYPFFRSPASPSDLQASSSSTRRIRANRSLVMSKSSDPLLSLV